MDQKRNRATESRVHGSDRAVVEESGGGNRDRRPWRVHGSADHVGEIKLEPCTVFELLRRSPPTIGLAEISVSVFVYVLGPQPTPCVEKKPRRRRGREEKEREREKREREKREGGGRREERGEMRENKGFFIFFYFKIIF